MESQIAKEVIGIVQNHYPERLGAAFLFNAPWYWHAFWGAISPFVDETTKSKIHMMKDLKKSNPLAEVADGMQYEKVYGGESDYQWNYERDHLKEDTEFPPCSRPNGSQ